jgi:hypothetical protein
MNLAMLLGILTMREFPATAIFVLCSRPHIPSLFALSYIFLMSASFQNISPQDPQTSAE